MSITYPNYPNTVFPDALQVFETYMDVTQNDVSIYNQAMEAINNNELTKAQNLINTIPNIQQKALTAEKLNIIIDTIQALQQYYNTDLDSKVATYQATWQTIINKFAYKGVWTQGQYAKNNMVSYSSNISGTDQTLYLYIATTDIASNISNPYADYENAISAGTTPNWYRITIRGKQGESGAGADSVSFRFQWDNATNYNVNDIVVYNNSWWIALNSNQGVEPTANSENWELVLNGNSTSVYPVQSDPPELSSINVGELWFEIID